MNILSLENVSKNYGIRPLFEGVTLGIEAGERVGIIGANGSGKTTLLRVIAGEEAPDTGRVMMADGKVLAFLSQNPSVDEGATVLETIFAASGGVMKLIRDYEAACHDLAAQGGTAGRLLDKVSDLQHRLESSGGWELETDARMVLTKLGISDTGARMETLSGGQRKRVALAHALIFRPDVLILDEPTNHLDADTVQWLEAYLARYTGTLLLVTHDRYFLDRVTTRILEIDRGAVQSFGGNYVYYLEKKEAQEAQRAVAGQKRKMLIRRELAWLRRGAKARTRKSKTRVDAAHAMMAQPVETAKAELDIAIGARRLGTKVVELHEVSKAYDGRILLDQFTYLLKRNERVGVIGPNGAGKTTLLEIITGRVQPDRGHVETGPTVVFGYYDQESRALNDEMRVIDYVREVAEHVRTKDGTLITASQMLERFLFPPATQYAPIAKLSGGERRRLYLLRVLMSAPNVLLLDEPTNDLDIPTLIALEEYLDDFAGSLVVVSHDRYFLDRTIDHVLRFEGDGSARAYPGDYSAYLEFREREDTAKAVETRATNAIYHPQPPVRNEPAAPRKLSFKERRELETLETAIAIAEKRKAEIEAELSAHASDAAKVQALFTKQQQLLRQLDDDMERWAELADRAEL
ncbi:MAG: ABC-F family ATP-binding cassette domain-containing protein [Pyrinomonadaceae bacterium]|nr:ABC-F family ATP-binding cassette domain-containing protein [Pyrinomonadaceae bacterium]